MGYLIPNSSPSVNINGRTIAVAAWKWDGFAGTFYQAGIYEMKADGWNLISPLVYNTGDLLGLIVQKGGSVKFLTWVVTELNRMLGEMFGVPPPPVSTEPTNDVEADAFLVSSFAHMKLTIINGTPVLG